MKARNTTVSTRVTEEEKALIRAAAASAGEDVASFLHRELLKVTREQLSERLAHRAVAGAR